MMPRGSARTLWATAWSARRIWSSSTSMVTILFMVVHNGMWMKLENKPKDADQVDDTCEHNAWQGERAGKRATLEGGCYRPVARVRVFK